MPSFGIAMDMEEKGWSCVLNFSEPGMIPEGGYSRSAGVGWARGAIGPFPGFLKTNTARMAHAQCSLAGHF